MPTFVDFLAVESSGRDVHSRLVFHNGYWATISPADADKEVVRTDKYDWSEDPRQW
jgi:hypothetical protein